MTTSILMCLYLAKINLITKSGWSLPCTDLDIGGQLGSSLNSSFQSSLLCSLLVHACWPVLVVVFHVLCQQAVHFAWSLSLLRNNWTCWNKDLTWVWHWRRQADHWYWGKENRWWADTRGERPSEVWYWGQRPVEVWYWGKEDHRRVWYWGERPLEVWYRGKEDHWWVWNWGN